MPKLSLSATALLFLALLTLGGCSSTPDSEDPSGWSAERYYEEARKALEIGDYQSAINHLENLEIQHPFSKFTAQGQLDIAYAYYKYNEPESALAAADRFIKLYPRHPRVDYALYLKGLANFERGVSALDLLLELETERRDPTFALASFRTFEELITRFPDSPYAADAKQRMIHLRNRLARHELLVADYYLRKRAHLAAANRAKYILEHYPRSQSVPEALKILVEAYRALGLDQLASDADKVLRLNYPERVNN